MSLEIQVDEQTQTVKINGVLFSFEVFQHFSNPDPNWFYSMRRENETVVLKTFVKEDETKEHIILRK